MEQLTPQGMIVIEGRATYERIVSYIRDVEPEEAIRQLQNFLKIYPEFAQAHNDLAVLYYHAGNGMKALAHYEKAHKLDPANMTYRKNLADFYFVELEWADDAVQIYLEILKDNPFDIETLNALGTINIQTGRREQARQYFTRTLELDTLNSQARQALQQLGAQLPAQPRPPQITGTSAPQYSLQAAKTAPPLQQTAPAQPPFQNPQKNLEQLYREALELADSGNETGAIRLLEDILLRHPGFATAHNDLGVLYQKGGDRSSARRHHEESVRLQPDNLNFRKNLADFLYIACGEPEEAMKLYVKILGSNPRDIETLKAVSGVCLEIGQPENARAFLENILKIEPWNSEARQALINIGAKQHTHSPSKMTANLSVEDMHAEAVRLSNDNRPNEACEMLEELARLHPGYAPAQNDLGVLRLKTGNIEGARRAYERAVELDPASTNFLKNLADLYFAKLGMVDDAIRIYLDLFHKNPRDVETLTSLGHICAAVGRPDEAKNFYRRALEIEPWNAQIRGILQGIVS